VRLKLVQQEVSVGGCPQSSIDSFVAAVPQGKGRRIDQMEIASAALGRPPGVQQAAFGLAARPAPEASAPGVTYQIIQDLLCSDWAMYRRYISISRPDIRRKNRRVAAIGETAGQCLSPQQHL